MTKGIEIPFDLMFKSAEQLRLENWVVQYFLNRHGTAQIDLKTGKKVGYKYRIYAEELEQMCLFGALYVERHPLENYTEITLELK